MRAGPPVRREVPTESDEGEASELALDDAITLPALDGEVGESEGAVIDDGAAEVADESVGLDDAVAEEAAEAVIDLLADVETESWETSEDDPVDADPELDAGESHAWTDGSDEDASTPIDLDEPAGVGGVGDAGEEGLEDDAGELELPPRPADVHEESYPDELDLG